MAGENDWVDVPAAAAPAKADDGWIDVPQEGTAPASNDNTPQVPISGAPAGFSSAGHDFVNSTATGTIMKAFGQGFREASGPEPLGLSPESTQWLSKIGIFAPEGQSKFENPFQAFSEGVIVPAAAALDGAIRMFNGTYRGLQSAGVEAGLPGDVVSLPDAFMGSPGALGEIAVRPGLPADIAKVIDEAPKAAEPPAATGLKLVDAPEGGVYTPEQFRPGEKYFKAVDADGNVSAEMLVKIDGKTARIEDILNPNAVREEGVGTIGVSDLRGLLKQFRDQHPEVEELTGKRVSGSRMGGEYSLTGDPSEVSVMLPQAKDLGVVGPDKPPITDGPPKDVAEQVISRNADQAPGEKVTQELPGQQDAWQQRFDGFVGKLDAPSDVQDLIRDAAKENGDFMPARQGDIPLSHVEAISEAAGVDPGSVDVRGLGRTLKNDNEVRTAMRLMLQVTDDVKSAARDVKADGSPENLIKLQESIMRRDMAVEQVVGLRAEWGRTGNVFQEFMRDVKDQQGLNDFLKDKGRNPADLKDIADAIDTLDRGSAAKVLNDMRGKQMSPFYYTWVNGLISGILTHTKYVAANAVYAASEHGVTTPIASVIGAAKKAFGSEADRVFFGESAASMWGMLSATPTALIAAGRSIRAGVRAPLESEVALRNAAIAAGERVPASLEKAVNPMNMGERPIPGVWGRIIGAPGDVAGAIHTFFKILGERAGIEAEAYHATAKEGLSPTDDQFWQRRAQHAANPTDDMRQRALEGAYKGTFMQELGPRGKAWQKMTKDIPGMKWIFPFAHIPINLMKATYEHTPAAIMDSEMRADITGANGGVRQDKAVARMVVGSSIMGWFVNAQMTGKATGDYPKDPKERDQWNLAGKQPNSILIGDHWVSYARFGPAGDLAALGANIGTVVQHLKSDDDDAMTKATMHAVLAAGKLVIDEAGFQSLQNIFEAYQDPDKRGAQFVASEASSLIPFSSLLGQTASFNDPDMRQAKTFIDGLKYRIPGLRETLMPKRDWSGLPIPNPQYGNILRQTQVKTDPVDMEMATLGIHPAPPQDRIKGVKLPPKMYDTYQSTAGPYTRTALGNMVNAPGWHDMPISVRQEVFKRTIEATRQGAAAAMQMRYPQLIQQGVSDRMAKINGGKPGKLTDAQ